MTAPNTALEAIELGPIAPRPERVVRVSDRAVHPTAILSP
jgi:hypothetical protein